MLICLLTRAPAPWPTHPPQRPTSRHRGTGGLGFKMSLGEGTQTSVHSSSNQAIVSAQSPNTQLLSQPRICQRRKMTGETRNICDVSPDAGQPTPFSTPACTTWKSTPPHLHNGSHRSTLLSVGDTAGQEPATSTACQQSTQEGTFQEQPGPQAGGVPLPSPPLLPIILGPHL